MSDQTGYAAVLYSSKATPGMFEFMAPYNQKFLIALKGHAHSAWWDGGRKVWMLSDGDLPAFRACAKLHFDLTEIVVRARPAPPVSGNGAGGGPMPTQREADLRLLGLAPGASDRLIDAAYVLAAQEHHPDVGGSNVKMAEINAARDRLKGKR